LLPFRWIHRARGTPASPQQPEAPLAQKVETTDQCKGHRLMYRRPSRLLREGPARNLHSSNLAMAFAKLPHWVTPILLIRGSRFYGGTVPRHAHATQAKERGPSGRLAT